MEIVEILFTLDQGLDQVVWPSPLPLAPVDSSPDCTESIFYSLCQCVKFKN